MKCPVVIFEMFMGFVWLWAACILKLRAAANIYYKTSIIEAKVLHREPKGKEQKVQEWTLSVGL